MQLHHNASHILLGRVYWQGRKAVWAGCKHFTLDIRSGGTVQPVCDCQWVCARVSEQQRARRCVKDWVCGTCVGVCVCGWAAFLSIKVTSGPPSASGEKWTLPDSLSLLLLFPCHHFLLIHREWGRHTSPAIATPLSQHYYRKLTHEDACITCTLIPTVWIILVKVITQGVSLSDRCEVGSNL